MGDIKVSLILPSLNVGQYIRKCLESVVSQTLRDIEIICVDAGSTDGTRETIAEFASRDSRIRVLDSDTKSYGYQMNMGLDAAQGEYIGIVETDDFILPDMYEVLYSAAILQDAEIVQSDYFYFWEAGGQKLQKRVNLFEQTDGYYRLMDSRVDRRCFFLPVITWNGIYRRDFIRQHDIRYHESPGSSYADNGFYFQVYAYARRLYFLPVAHYMCRRDNPSSSVFNSGNMVRMLDEHVYIRNLMKKDEAVFREFQHEYFWMYVMNCRWAFDNLRYGDMGKFLQRFGEEAREMCILGMYRHTLFDAAACEFLFTAMYDTDFYIEQNVRCKAEFYKKISEEQNVIIYGAGKVGMMTMDEMRVNAPHVKIIGMAVTRKEENKSIQQGIRVYSIQELQEYRREAMVIVAVRESLHAEIKRILQSLGFEKMCFVTWTKSLGGEYRRQFSLG